MQTVQCVRKVPYTVCRQVPETTTICVPVTIKRQVTELKTIQVPRTICRQVPVEVCVKVPVTVTCPPVMPSPQSVVASAQSEVSFTPLPACDSCDKKHPLFGRAFR
jgi:hypothetical protein